MEKLTMKLWKLAAVLAVGVLATKAGRTYAKKALRTGMNTAFMVNIASEEFIEKAKAFTESMCSDVNEKCADIKDKVSNIKEKVETAVSK